MNRSVHSNAFCERVIGTVRRECLDFVIPLNERHLRRVFDEWVRHYNFGRLHASLGPGRTVRKPRRWRLDVNSAGDSGAIDHDVRGRLATARAAGSD